MLLSGVCCALMTCICCCQDSAVQSLLPRPLTYSVMVDVKHAHQQQSATWPK
jgi:hypothetical protein